MKASIEISEEQLGVIHLFDTAVLIAAARGELDLNHIARETLASRGLNADGKWVGFDEAKTMLLASSQIKHSCRNRLDYLPLWVKQKSSN